MLIREDIYLFFLFLIILVISFWFVLNLIFDLIYFLKHNCKFILLIFLYFFNFLISHYIT